MRAWSPARRAFVAVALVTLAAGAVRLHDLGRPDEKIFDETYYASDACWHAGIPYSQCDLERDVEQSWVHPPLGKIAIAWGIDAFGNRPLGWRISAALAGTATVALIGALAFLLTGSALWAGVGSLLLAVESLHFVQSRIAMLDVFLALFVVLGFTLLAWDRHRREEADIARLEAAATRSQSPQMGPSDPGEEADEPLATTLARPRIRPLRLLAGASFGAAIAVKWAGIAALAGAAILAFAWERTRLARSEDKRPTRRALLTELPRMLPALVLVPVLVYAVAWLPWLADRGFSPVEWYRHHALMAGYHLELDTLTADGEPVHPYMSEAWTWLLLLRPVAYFFTSDAWGEPGATAREILAVGNPVLFWGALALIPYLAYRWIRRREWQAGMVLVAILFQYLPWLAARRPLFLFYMTPVAPFLALGMTMLVRDLAGARIRGRRVLMPLAIVIVAAAVALFAFFWPVLVGRALSTDAWETRIWFERWV